MSKRRNLKTAIHATKSGRNDDVTPGRQYVCDLCTNLCPGSSELNSA